MFIHHAGNSGAQRGTSKREDVLDTVVALKRPGDYVASQGVRFEVHFEKARGIFGDDALPFELTYQVRDNAAELLRQEIEDGTLTRVVDLLKGGMTFRDTARDLCLDKSKVQRLKMRAQEQGLLDVRRRQ